MIIAYTGMPGSGKTYALVQRADKALRQGRMVFANFPLKGCYQISLDDICNFQFPEDCVVLIDEAGRWFNSREWKDLPHEVFDLFTMHRHVKMDLFIAVQSFARIDKSLREVVELVYWSTNRAWLPFHNYYGYYDLEKLGSMKGEHHAKHIVWKNKRLRSYYDTFSMKQKFAHKPFIALKRWSFVPKTKKEIVIQSSRVFVKQRKRMVVKSVRAFLKNTFYRSTFEQKSVFHIALQKMRIKYKKMKKRIKKLKAQTR